MLNENWDKIDKKVEDNSSAIGQIYEKKLDKSGGEMTGDLVLKAGLTHVKNTFFSKTNVYKINELTLKQGILKILTPPEVKLFANTLFRITIRGANLSTGQMAWELFIGGYTRSQMSDIDCPTSIIIGTCPFDSVRFVNDNGRLAILLGKPDTIWSHTTMMSIDVDTLHTDSSLWGGVWSHEFITSDVGLVALASPSLKYGGIHSRGSNANGDWVRFEDGTQICTGKLERVNTNINIATGNLFRNEGTGFIYPANFVNIPSVSTSFNSADGGTSFIWMGSDWNNRFTNSFTGYTLSSISRNLVNYTIFFTAIGRWK